MVTPSLREYNNAGLDSAMLSRIADASGGRYYDLPQIRQLVNDIEHVPGAFSREVQEDLWDLPFLLALPAVALADHCLRDTGWPNAPGRHHRDPRHSSRSAF